MLTRWLAALGGFCVVLSGCWEKDKTPSTTAAIDPSKRAEEPECCMVEEETPFHSRLQKIAAEYREYGRVDDRMRWASTLCLPITASTYSPSSSPPPPPVLHVSASKNEQGHGRKLYSIFAKISEQGRYLNEDAANPVGQVIVKESWIPEEIPDHGQALQVVVRKIKVRVKDAKDRTTTNEMDDRFVPDVRQDGRLYHASRQGPLFIMFKMDPATAGTDEGWVYGTITADGEKVLMAGRIASCMSCHTKAPHDRLFGLPR